MKEGGNNNHRAARRGAVVQGGREEELRRPAAPLGKALLLLPPIPASLISIGVVWSRRMNFVCSLSRQMVNSKRRGLTAPQSFHVQWPVVSVPHRDTRAHIHVLCEDSLSLSLSLALSLSLFSHSTAW